MKEFLVEFLGAVIEFASGSLASEFQRDFSLRNTSTANRRLFRDRCIAYVCFIFVILGSAWLLMHWLLD